MNSSLREDSRTEFKECLNDKFEKEVIGFLNANGGDLYIGINDSGEPVELEEDIDDLQLKIKDKIKNNIMPSTLGLFDIEIVTMNDKKIIHIIIAGGNLKPYYLRSKGMVPSGTFMRIGSSTEQLNEEKIEEFYSSRTRVSLKNIASPIQQLSFSQLKIYYDELGYNVNDNFLRQLEFYMDDGRYNYLAYILSDNNNVSIKVATYSGNDSYDLIENEEYGFCCLVKATKRVIEKFDMINKTYSKITSAERKEVKKFDSVAVREAIVNAFVHNNWERENPPKFEIFNDHISITSTGGIPNGISQDEFLKGYSFPRYPELMRVFKDLELVEQLGTGITRIMKAYDKSVYEFSTNFIRINLKYNSNKLLDNMDKKSYVLDEMENKIVDIMINNPKITLGEVANNIKKSLSTVDRKVKKLKTNGIIERVGSDKDGYWQINN